MLGIIFGKQDKEAIIKGTKIAHILKKGTGIKEGQTLLALISDKDCVQDTENAENIGKIIVKKIEEKLAKDVTQDESWNCNYKRMWELKNLLFQQEQIRETTEIEYLEFNFYPKE